MLHGRCSCGSVRLSIDVDPIMTYNCHCSRCRSFANADFHQGAAVWSWNAQVEGDLEYKNTTSLFGLFAMSRGSCAKCKDPMYEACHRLIAPYAMVSSKPFGFKANSNLFYDSGKQLGTQGLRTVRSDIGSLLFEILMIIFVAIPSIPRSLIARMNRKKNRVS